MECWLVGPAKEMMRLAFVDNDPDIPGQQTIEGRGFPVWLHNACWLRYCEIAASAVDLSGVEIIVGASAAGPEHGGYAGDEMVNPFDMACEVARLVDAGKSCHKVALEMRRLFPTATLADVQRAFRIGLDRRNWRGPHVFEARQDQELKCRSQTGMSE